jgi:hypothetical protein
MIGSPIIAATFAAMALFLAGSAYALTLTNQGEAEQHLVITQGGDESSSQEVFIAANQTLQDLCQDRCTIALENGLQESFEGNENVFIKDGGFTIAE